MNAETRHVAGQLTYTSFDSPGQRGGWQVKQSLGVVDPDLQEGLVARALGTLDHVGEVPRFPTAEDLLARPRRLAYGPVEAGAPGLPWAFWHTIPAGPDASGRSNVFNQMLVPETGWSGRPALWCSSPDWLTPFGADAVREAEMPSSTPAPNPSLQNAAIEFLFSGSERLGALGILADAVMAAMTGGPPVALLLEDMTHAAHWFVLVELAMSEGAASRLAFSTLERASDQTRWAAQGFHLVAVPASDLPSLTRSSACLPFIPDSFHLSPMRGEPHRTSLSAEVPDTELSVLVMDRFTSPADMADSLSMIDTIAHRVGDQSLDPRWPLAMGCWLGDPGDLRLECAEVITLTSPSAVAEHLDMSEALQEGLRYLGSGPNKELNAWRRLSYLFEEGRNASDHVVRAAAGFYGELALGSPRWLSQRSSHCVPPAQLTTLHTPEQMARVSNALRALASPEVSSGEEAAIIQWNAVLLLSQLGWPLDEEGRSARQDLLDGPLIRAITGTVGESMSRGWAAGALANTEGPDGSDLLMSLMQSDVEPLRGKARPGHWLPAWFADLFHLTAPQRVSLVLDAGRHHVNPDAQFELAACILRTQAQLEPSMGQRLRELVAKGLQTSWIRSQDRQYGFPMPEDPILVPLVASGPIRLAGLRVEPHLMPREWVLRPLLLDPVDGVLLQLMERLRGSGDPMVAGLVNLRDEVSRGWDLGVGRQALFGGVNAAMDAWKLLAPAFPQDERPDSEMLGGAAIRATAYWLLFGTGAETDVLAIATWLQTPGFRIDVSKQAPRAATFGRKILSKDSLALWRLLINTHPESPLPTQGREGAVALGHVCHRASTPDLVSLVVHAAHSSDSEETRLAMWSTLAKLAEEYRVKPSETEKFFKKWWREMGGAKGTGTLAGAVGSWGRPWRKKES